MIDRCPYCGSEDIYFSKKRSLYVCEDCDRTFSEQDAYAENESHFEQRGLELFFSYGHDRNRLLVERMKKDLESRGHHVWIDKSEIKVGDSWRQDIVNGLLNTAGVIAFLSEHSTRNPGVCLDELKIAICVKGANIKTVLLEPETRIKQPATLSDIQWLDMSNWQDVKQAGDEAFEKWYKEKFAELCTSLESADSREFSGDIHFLKEALSPYLNSEKEYSLLSKPYYGRKWLEESIENWQDRTDSRAIVVYGKPGSGKSAFAVNYAHYNSDVYGCFLCEWNREYTTNPHRFIRTLAFRLATKLPDYRSFLLHQLSQNPVNLDGMSEQALFEFLVSYPLNHLVDGNRETGIIIVDGLDEATVAGDNPLAQMFSTCVRAMPRWIKFIFTSRPERNVISQFQSYASIDLVDDMPVGYNDIMAYLLKTLTVELRQVPNKLEIINKICEQSDGAFQYAVLLVEDIKNGMTTLQETTSFPKGLTEIYRNMIRRRFPAIKDYAQIKPFLEVMCISDTIPEDLVINVCGFTQYEYLRQLDILGSLVERNQGEDGLTELLFSHKSYSDWFTSAHKSNQYYIDQRNGAYRLALFAQSVIEKSAVSPNSFDIRLVKYLRKHIGSYFIEASKYEELESFLISQDQTLYPYWNIWNLFPSDWDNSRLLTALWHSPGRDQYLKALQREGNTEYICWIFDLAIQHYGIDMLSRNLISIYIDIVHLSGNYAKAVEIAENYLQGFSLESVLADEFLMMLAVRRIHHSMFYKPAQRLIDEARALLLHADSKFPKVYNEILFLLGGNLGVLSGNWSFAKSWLSSSKEFAQEHQLQDFNLRNARKIADCLCAENRLEEAKTAINSSMTNPNKIETRYDAYLTGALANIYTCLGDDDEALHCYESMQQYVTANGITGWCAHAYLGIANVYFKLGNLKEAIDYASRANIIYQQIHQEWGIIMSDALLAAADSRLGCEPISVACRKMIDHARKLQYGSCVESIEAMCSGKVNYLKLYFL